jgi:hypothetical protein
MRFVELETGNRNATAVSENCYQPELNTLLNGAAQIAGTATQLRTHQAPHYEKAYVTFARTRVLTLLI